MTSPVVGPGILGKAFLQERRVAREEDPSCCCEGVLFGKIWDLEGGGGAMVTRNGSFDVGGWGLTVFRSQILNGKMKAGKARPGREDS